MYSILDRYIGKIIFSNIFVVLFVLLSLSSIIKFIDELRKIGQGSYGFLEISLYVFLSIAKDVEIFLPMSVLLGVVLGLGLFLIRNELIIMEVFGFSRLRMACSLLKISLPIILFGICISEWIVPISERTARNYRYKMMNNVSMRIFSDLWIKDGNNFVYIEKMSRYDQLLGMRIYYFDQDRHLRSVCHVASAKFVNNIWNLVNVHELCFNYHNVRIIEKRILRDVWLTSITPSYLLMTVMSLHYSSSLSVFDLYRCILLFNENGTNIASYQLRFWKKVLFPMSIVVIMLTALSSIVKSLLCKISFGHQIMVGLVYSFFFMF